MLQMASQEDASEVSNANNYSHNNSNSNSFFPSSPSAAASAAAAAFSSTSRLLFSNMANASRDAATMATTANNRRIRRRSSLFGALNSSKSGLERKTRALFQFGKQQQQQQQPTTSPAMAHAASSARAAAAVVGRSVPLDGDEVSTQSRSTILSSPSDPRRVSIFSRSSPSSSSSSKRSLFGAVMEKFGPPASQASSNLGESVDGGGGTRVAETGVEEISTMSTPTKSRVSTTGTAWGMGQRLDFAEAAATLHSQEADSNEFSTRTSGIRTRTVGFGSPSKYPTRQSAMAAAINNMHPPIGTTAASTPTHGQAAATGWMVSPRGNSIMNIVNRMVMNSPFRFQSPAKKIRGRTNSTSLRKNSAITSSSPTSASASPSIATTPQQRNVKRRRLNLDSDDDYPGMTITPTTCVEKARDSNRTRARSSSVGNASTHNSELSPSTPQSSKSHRRRLKTPQHDEADDWHETSLVANGSSSVVDTSDSFCGMSLLDWSLKHRVRLECQPAQCLFDTITPSWTLPSSFSYYPQWEAALAYWQHPAAPLPLSILLVLQQHQRQQEREEQARNATASNTQTTLFGTRQQHHPEPLSVKSRKDLERSFSTTCSTSSRLGLVRTGSLTRKGSNSNNNNGMKQGQQPPHDPSSKQKVNTSDSLDDDTLLTSSERQEEFARRLIRSAKGHHTHLFRAALNTVPNFRNCDLVGGVSLFLDQRQREWQEALRSVFHKWQSQFERLLQSVSSQTVSSSTTTLKLQPLEWMDCYFYCHAHDHVVLFRLARDPEEDTLVPQLLLSNTTRSVAQKLLRMGVDSVDHLNPTLVNDEPDKRDLSKEWSSPSAKDDRDKPQDGRSPMSPTLVLAELEALRQAQVNGFIAGADVSVKLKTKNNSSNNQEGKKDDLPQFTGPLLLQGMDNIALFVEIYLNSLGCLSDWARKEEMEDAQPKKQSSGMPSTIDRTQKGQAPALPPFDLPLILCRALGPFTNATRKLMSVFPSPSPSVEDAAIRQNENDPNRKNTSVASTDPAAPASSYAALEIEGSPVVLPCAIRAMVGVLTTSLMAHHRDNNINQVEAMVENDDIKDSNKKEAIEPADSVGSHHILFHLSTERPTLVSSTTTEANIPATDFTSVVWTQTSAWLNHHHQRDSTPMRHLGARRNIAIAGVDECHGGQVANLMVWDVTRKDTIAYQAAEPLSTRLTTLEQNLAQRS
jgi:hypothetical protein